MPTKKKSESKTTQKIKKTGKSVVTETHSRSVRIYGRNGEKYVDINALIALIVTLIFPYVAVIILIIALFGGLDIEIVKKPKTKKKATSKKKPSPKKKTTPKRKAKTMAKK